MFQNDTELDKYCSGAHKGRPQQLEDPVYPRGKVLFNNPQVPDSGTLRRCHKPCIPCLFLYTPASRGISGTLQTLQKGVWEGVQNAVLRGPQTGIYRVLHGWCMPATYYPEICHVVCTPGPSVHRYPTVPTCNDTSIHYIRVYTCVYT